MATIYGPRFRRLIALACIYSCTCPIPNSRGQDPFELGILSKTDEPVVCVSPFGVEARRRTVLQINDPFGRLSFATPGVEKELELTAAQRNDLRQLEMQNKEFVQSQFEEMISSATNLVGYSRRFDQRRAELNDEVSKILRPQQIERMNQLANRLFIRRFGLGFFLETREASHEISVSANDRSAISEEAKELLAEVQETKAQLHAEVLECVLNELDEKQLSALGIYDKDEFIGKTTKSEGDAALDLLISQVRDSTWKSTESPELPNGFPLVVTQVFVANAHGDLARFRLGFQTRVCEGERVVGYGQIFALILSDSSRAALGITDEQVAELRKSEDYLVEKLVEIDLFVFQDPNPWNANENATDMQISLGNELDARLNKILTMDQSAKLRALGRKLTSIGSGWLVALNDELRTQKYPLSAGQMGRLDSKLKAKCADVSKRISDVTGKTSLALTAQISDAELRSYLDKQFGKNDDLVGGNLVFLIADLRALANWKK